MVIVDYQKEYICKMSKPSKKEYRNLTTEIYKGYHIKTVKDKNYGLIFITDIVNYDLKHTLNADGTEFKSKEKTIKYAKNLIIMQRLK